MEMNLQLVGEFSSACRILVVDLVEQFEMPDWDADVTIKVREMTRAWEVA